MGTVHRALLMALTWVASTAAGVALGWQGVQLVTFQVVESQAAPLSQPHVLEALEAAGGSPGTAAAAPATPEIPALQAAPAPAPAPSKVLPPPGGDLPAPLAPGAGSPPTAVVPPVTVSAAGTGVAPVTTTTVTVVPATSTTTTTTVPSTTTTTTRVEKQPPAEQKQAPASSENPAFRMISAEGGTVAVRYEAGRVRLLWARPNDGFRVNVAEDGPEAVDVIFRSRQHYSRIRALWADGAPRHQVVERPSGEHDSD